MTRRRFGSLAALGAGVFVFLAGALWFFAGRPHRYVDDVLGFSIEFSPEYAIRPKGGGADVGGYRETGAGGADAVSVIVNTIANFTSAATYRDWYLGASTGGLAEFTRLRDGTGTVGDAKGAWTEFVYRPEKERMQVWQVFLIRGTRGYVISCAARPQDFERARPDFEKAVDSFRFE